MASRGQMLHVVVQLPNKQEVELKLPEKSPVTDIFALCETHSDPPLRFDPKSCQLFWNGSRLGNNMYLDYYRIPHKAKLVVSRRLVPAQGGGRGGSRATSAVSRREQQAAGYDDGNHYNGSNTSRPLSNVASRSTSALRRQDGGGRQSMNTSFEGRSVRIAPQSSPSSRPGSPHRLPNNNYDHYQPDQQQFHGSADASNTHPSALHSYRVRELEVQLSRANEQYRSAQDRIAELESSVQRLSFIAKRALEMQQQQAQFPAIPVPGLDALRSEFLQHAGDEGAPGSVLRSPPHPSSSTQWHGTHPAAGSPHSVASTAAPYNPAYRSYPPPQPAGDQQDMHRQLEELRESYRRQPMRPQSGMAL